MLCRGEAIIKSSSFSSCDLDLDEVFEFELGALSGCCAGILFRDFLRFDDCDDDEDDDAEVGEDEAGSDNRKHPVSMTAPSPGVQIVYL